MKPVADTLVQTDELPGEEIEFGIGDPRWVMRTQAELYSDVTTAIIREYSTNAYDAHVMAGHTDPIEVSLPSQMSPYFIVKDHGVGMDMEIFRKIYTQFGISDKRESNSTNGMLGYGSKSGIAYTTSFSVESVRNGHKVSGVIMRKPDWRIVLKVVAQHKTDEPNGTVIKIPVHNIDEFNTKAKAFYRFWLPGRVLVNGKAPLHHVGKKVTDNLYYSQEWNTSYVVMGNVAYRIANPSYLFNQVQMQAMNFVAYVDDLKTADGGAAVEFTPSREDLKYTNRTNESLVRVIKDFEEKILISARKDIATAANHAEAYKKWNEWGNLVGKQLFTTLEYKGDKLVDKFEIRGERYKRNAYRNTCKIIDTWNVQSMHETMVITHFTPTNLSSDHKAKVKQYASMQGWAVNYFIFCDGDDGVTSPWVSKEKFVKWETLKAALPKKPKQPRYNDGGPSRLRGSFDTIVAGGRKYEQTLNKNDEHFWISVHEDKGFLVSALLGLLKSEAVVVILPANRVNKFTRENPQVPRFIPYVQAKVEKDASKTLSEDAKKVWGFLNVSSNRWLNTLSASKVDDPEIANLQSLWQRREALLKDYERNKNLAYHSKVYVTDYQGKPSTYLSDTYPLLAHVGATVNPKIIDDVYLYINAAYAARKEDK